MGGSDFLRSDQSHQFLRLALYPSEGWSRGPKESKCFPPYDRIGAPRFPASKPLGDYGGDGSGKVLPESLFQGLPLLLRQSVDANEYYAVVVANHFAKALDLNISDMKFLDEMTLMLPLRLVVTDYRKIAVT